MSEPFRMPDGRFVELDFEDMILNDDLGVYAPPNQSELLRDRMRQRRNVDARGLVQVGTTMLTGMAAEAPAGINLLTSMARGRGLEQSVRDAEATQEALTYTPRARSGMQALQNIGEAVEPVANYFATKVNPKIESGLKYAVPTMVGQGIIYGLMMALTETVGPGGKPADVQRTVRKVARDNNLSESDLTEMLMQAAETDPNIAQALAELQAGGDMPSRADRLPASSNVLYRDANLITDAENAQLMDTPFTTQPVTDPGGAKAIAPGDRMPANDSGDFFGDFYRMNDEVKATVPAGKPSYVQVLNELEAKYPEEAKRLNLAASRNPAVREAIASRNTDFLTREMSDPLAAQRDNTRPVAVGGRQRGSIGGRSTIRGAQRKAFPGIYKDPSQLAEEASRQVAPESPSLSRLFGVTRADLADAAREPGSMKAQIPGVGGRAGGSAAVTPITKPANTNRLLTALRTADREAPELVEGMRGWYIMQPAYNRILELSDGDERLAMMIFDQFNSLSGMASPGSPVHI